jgi:hypothetical protein
MQVSKRSPMRSPLLLLKTGLVLACLASAPLAHAQPLVIYSTGFEVEEGFNQDFTLVGQGGWVGSGTGGNGLVDGFFPGLGQQGFIGFIPPEGNEDLLNVWRPINLAPIPAGQQLIRFSVLMEIVDSSTPQGPWDDFRWSIYNAAGHRLFTVDFETSTLQISYALDDAHGFVSTGTAFDLEGFYNLDVWMNFQRNVWSASLNNFVIINSQPITTTGAALNLGDINAVWAIRNPGNPGDNFMVFDNYEITAQPVDSIPPNLEVLGFQTDGQFLVRIYGEEGLNYRIETSSNLQQWAPQATLTAPAGGTFNFADPAANGSAVRFYRVQRVL